MFRARTRFQRAGAGVERTVFKTARQNSIRESVSVRYRESDPRVNYYLLSFISEAGHDSGLTWVTHLTRVNPDVTRVRGDSGHLKTDLGHHH